LSRLSKVEEEVLNRSTAQLPNPNKSEKERISHRLAQIKKQKD
jgi:hypothetical protein